VIYLCLEGEPKSRASTLFDKQVPFKVNNTINDKMLGCVENVYIKNKKMYTFLSYNMRRFIVFNNRIKNQLLVFQCVVKNGISRNHSYFILNSIVIHYYFPTFIL
jgi:hypothetical protein